MPVVDRPIYEEVGDDCMLFDSIENSVQLKIWISYRWWPTPGNIQKVYDKILGGFDGK